MSKIIIMAFRNLGRNRRRSILSALALSVSLALLIFMSAFNRGQIRSSMETTLNLDSGHIQVRATDYDPDKLSVAWEYLLENPEQAAAQIEALDQVKVATPRLIASGIVSVQDQHSGVKIMGVDPASIANAPFIDGLVEGEFLTADDREGILIGYPLAENLKIGIGDQINLLVNTSAGSVDEQSFTIRGIFSTNSTAYDKAIVLMPIAKAQAFSGADKHASFIFVLLHNRDDAKAVAAALKNPNLQVETWAEMNDILVVMDEFSNAFILILGSIVLGITATVIVNTLIMSVFERTREIGVLTSIGMKGSQIMSLFLVEASFLAAGGIAFGLLVGWALSAYYGMVGIYFGDLGVTGILLGDRIYAYLTLEDTIKLTITALVITLLASIYPALLASRMEPVEALHGKN
ncbi:MAG: ABC transporter permease [Anaerolineae bacterium]|nr:ABC transporter permease [Anaerolineae bacterium]MDK1117411.1 ABC transporter permease [Anaerolineae bacterium]